ncbi:proteophosphoglycan ppg4 [Rhodotorula toruloides]|uniref:Proteophosphoglycan ppg4 n=1 Tax=Rhodotorula toruloides TaxID=5286 RepID=A0A511K8C3_RHOTO|nr:proteophosphoglycan ppg4 [Rhodotorula toruloides]
MATYDNGLYTPWTPAGGNGAETTSAAAWAGETAATSTSAASDTWAATTTTSAEAVRTAETTTTQAASSTSMTPAWSAEGTTTSVWTAWTPSTTTTTPAWTPASLSTTSQWSAPSTTAPSASSSSSTARLSSSSSTTPPPSSVFSVTDSSANKYATVSRYASPSGAALSSSSSGHSFKMTYLIPAFVVVPLALLFVVLGCTYGKWWGRLRKESQTPLSEGVGGMGWWGGRGGSRRSRRSAYDDDTEETGGLVEAEKYRDAMDDYDEKRFTLPSVEGGETGATRRGGGGGGQSRWSNFFASSSANKHTGLASRPDFAVPFLSVSHASTPEQPFVPPSRSSSTQDFPRWPARGAVAPRVAPRGPTTNGGFLAAGAWGTGARSNRQSGLARNVSGRSTSSVGSRLSDRIFGRFGIGGRSPDACPSPSVYSPTPEESGQSHQSFGAAGAYMGVHMEDEREDDFADEKHDVDYDAFLAAGRVGDGELARRYAKGEIKESDIFPPREPPRYPEGDARERYYARQGPTPLAPFPAPEPAQPPSFAVNLPAAPSRLQVSPKKTASTLVRPAPPETPEKGNLLFSYASPPPPQPHGSPRPPLPPIPHHHKKVSPTKAPLTEPPARTPFRQQTAPQLVRPPRHHDPFAPEPTSQFQQQPIFPSARQSRETTRDSAFSLDVYGAIVDTAEEAEQQVTKRRSGTTTSSRSATPTKQLQRSTPVRSDTDVRPGTLISSATDLQARKMPSRESIPRSSSVSPTKDIGRRREAPPTSSGRSRPVSAYAELPTQAQKEQEIRKIASRQDLKPISKAKARESLAFDAAFSESAALAPLQHPNKVRAAVENIETREPSSSRKIPSSHRKTPSRDSGRSAVSDKTTSSGGKLGRSATAAPSTTTYRRPLGNKGLVSDNESDSDDSEAIGTNRRLSMLILNRSRSQSGSLPSGPGSGDSHGSLTLEDEDKARDDDKKEDGGEKGGVSGLLDAMKRRSGIFDDAK